MNHRIDLLLGERKMDQLGRLRCHEPQLAFESPTPCSPPVRLHMSMQIIEVADPQKALYVWNTDEKNFYVLRYTSIQACKLCQITWGWKILVAWPEVDMSVATTTNRPVFGTFCLIVQKFKCVTLHLVLKGERLGRRDFVTNKQDPRDSEVSTTFEPVAKKVRVALCEWGKRNISRAKDTFLGLVMNNQQIVFRCPWLQHGPWTQSAGSTIFCKQSFVF